MNDGDKIPSGRLKQEERPLTGKGMEEKNGGGAKGWMRVGWLGARSRVKIREAEARTGKK